MHACQQVSADVTDNVTYLLLYLY